MNEKIRHVSMISGRGSTMEAIVRACRSGELGDMETVGIIASNLYAYQAAMAKRLGIPIALMDPKIEKRHFGNNIVDTLKRWKADIVTQNGWLPLTPQVVIDEFEDLYNQHPGPQELGGKGMYGARVTAARLALIDIVGRDWWTEAIVQRVGATFDEGRVLKVGRVEVLPHDTVETLQPRLLSMEHRIQIKFLQELICDDLQPMSKRAPLVKLGEVHILEEAKRIGIALYPRG